MKQDGRKTDRILKNKSEQDGRECFTLMTFSSDTGTPFTPENADPAASSVTHSTQNVTISRDAARNLPPPPQQLAACLQMVAGSGTRHCTCAGTCSCRLL